MTKSMIQNVLSAIVSKECVLKLYLITKNTSIISCSVNVGGINCPPGYCECCPYHENNILDFVQNNRGEIAKEYIRRIQNGLQ